MTNFTINHVSPAKNKGIAREHDLCAYMGINRTTHDSGSYMAGSDIETGDFNISVKASGFTLMSGSLCEGLTDFEAIWNLYMTNTHSNAWAYITTDYQVYMMNAIEFCEFVHTFCYMEKESAKNGGGMKIRCKKESKKMISWLENRVG